MNIWQQKTSIISKLRVEGNGFDTVATRLRFDRLFGAADFLPAGLPSKAVICIKKLRDPAPRTLQLNRVDLKHTDFWRNSVAKEIDALFRRAFRPISEIVPAQAESVVFADDSELLACLASDWCENLLHRNWWWRSLFPDIRQAQTIARIWIEAAEFVPAALRLLSEKGKAAEFATKLQPDEIKNLLRQIIFVFGLDKLQAALFEPFEKETESDFSPPENLTATEIPRIEDYFFDAPQISAPWIGFVPETRNPALSFERQCLLGIGLSLARAPRTARSPEFARQTKIFRFAFEIKKRTSQKENKISERTRKTKEQTKKIGEFSFPSKKPKSPPILDESKIETKESAEGKASENLKDTTDAIEKNVKTKKKSDVSESKISSPTEKTPTAASNFVFEDFRSENIPERRQSGKKTKHYQPEKQLIRQEFFADSSEEFETETIIETLFGGVFYLLNLGLHLNLYRDFSAATQPEIDLNIWDFAALLGREFLGEKFEKDAIWKLLEQLSGRKNGEEPGDGFAPPDDWQMPSEWLETFQTNEKWLWRSDGERLIVRHPAGFKIIDVKLSGDAKSRLENELKIYRKNPSQCAESSVKEVSEASSLLENWLQNLSEFARLRLLQALNLQTPQQINAILFERKATVIVSETNLDVTFSLADLPFEIRLSGLDRDPGWIPAAGKFVKFHFI